MKTIRRLASLIIRIFKNRKLKNRSYFLFNFLRLEIINFIFSKPETPKTIPFLHYKISTPSISCLKFLIEEIFIDQIYDCKMKTDSPLIFDCGGNIGLSVLYFKWRWPKAKVLCFEPDPDIFLYLKKNIEENGLSGVLLYNFALGDSNSELEFYRSKHSPLISSTHSRNHHDESLLVKVKCLSDLLGEPVDLLKIDVEGAEWSILIDLVKSGKINYISNIVMELHHQMISNKSTGDFLLTLERNNFSYQIRNCGFNENNFKSSQEILLYGSKDSNS